MKQINDNEYMSDEGKMFEHKETGVVFGWGIYIGENDSIDNYVEVDCLEEYKGNPDYDNTIEEEPLPKVEKRKTPIVNKENIE